MKKKERRKSINKNWMLCYIYMHVYKMIKTIIIIIINVIKENFNNDYDQLK